MYQGFVLMKLMRKEDLQNWKDLLIGLERLIMCLIQEDNNEEDIEVYESDYEEVPIEQNILNLISKI